jgi:bacillithiol biosynthesis deacetylase BshB1
MKHLSLGKKAGILDLTRGEMGTRGSAGLRDQEAAQAAKIMGISIRENLNMPDCFFKINKKNKVAIATIIRKYRPDIVLCNAISDRHPDHGRAAQLVSEACFVSGLIKLETELNGTAQLAWRPIAVYHYIQDNWIEPQIVVDINGFMDKKMEAIKAYSSQFYNPESNEPVTAISTPEFMEFVKSRALQFGRLIKTKYGEGFTIERPVGVTDLSSII